MSTPGCAACRQAADPRHLERLQRDAAGIWPNWRRQNVSAARPAARPAATQPVDRSRRPQQTAGTVQLGGPKRATRTQRSVVDSGVGRRARRPWAHPSHHCCGHVAPAGRARCNAAHATRCNPPAAVRYTVMNSSEDPSKARPSAHRGPTALPLHDRAVMGYRAVQRGAVLWWDAAQHRRA